jgi:hypothetical protein
MSTNPLLDAFLLENPGNGAITASRLQDFISRMLGDTGNFHNFDPVTGAARTSHSVTVLYSGNMGGYGGNIATDLANRLNGEGRVLDNTKMGRFLDAVDNKELR